MSPKEIREVKGKNGEPIIDVVKIIDLAVRSGKRSKYATGILMDTYGNKYTFNCWDETLSLKMQDLYQVKELVGEVAGNTNIYNDNFQVVIDKMNTEITIDSSIFLQTPYNANEIWSDVNSLIHTKTSEKAHAVLNMILTSKEGLFKRFLEEFSAKSHHDNVRHGLLAHTAKMINIGSVIEGQHPNLFKTQDQIDLFYIGLLVHDIGKTLEMYNGQYMANSFVSHRFLGAELVTEVKTQIVDTYSEEWFYQLIAIILQHHGHFEERPRTPMALLIHYIDSFEAQVTNLDEKVQESDDTPVINSVFGDDYLHLTKATF
ncbi:HD domain-containing protein [Enterococcus casseliflavus]|uniref:HD domain-containing protein n=1 Tax=Enterococcus casseliflavus TaxID=37734 RepID=UPI0039A76D91